MSNLRVRFCWIIYIITSHGDDDDDEYILTDFYLYYLKFLKSTSDYLEPKLTLLATQSPNFLERGLDWVLLVLGTVTERAAVAGLTRGARNRKLPTFSVDLIPPSCLSCSSPHYTRT